MLYRGGQIVGKEQVVPTGFGKWVVPVVILDVEINSQLPSVKQVEIFLPNLALRSSRSKVIPMPQTLRYLHLLITLLPEKEFLISIAGKSN
jgi:hypothetical protein